MEQDIGVWPRPSDDDVIQRMRAELDAYRRRYVDHTLGGVDYFGLYVASAVDEVLSKQPICGISQVMEKVDPLLQESALLAGIELYVSIGSPIFDTCDATTTKRGKVTAFTKDGWGDLPLVDTF